MKINIFDLSNEELVAYMLSISDEMRIRGMQKGCVEETYQRLQEENKELKAENAILILANSGIEEKNEQLNERVKTFTKPKYYYKGLQKTEEEKDKYKQALEEIREEANRLLYEENPIYGYNDSNYFELLAKYVLAKIKEVLK